jgi:hypothetical protein
VTLRELRGCVSKQRAKSTYTGMRARVMAIVLLVLSASLPLLSQQDSPGPAKWQPKFEFNGELFPSFVLSMNGRASSVLTTPEQHAGVWWIGDRAPMASVAIRPTVANAKVHVAIQIDGFTDVSTIDATLPDAGQTYIVSPVLRYNYAHLASIDQSVPATVTYAVRVNDSDLGQQTVSIRVRSVNDVPTGMVRSDGTFQDFSSLFAGYVNESHPFVEKVLQEALASKIVNSFDGYQKGRVDDVALQVFAVWYVLQQHGLHYSSVTTPSASSSTGHVASQAVRFIDQSVESQQANCVDGSVLFASVLYKIGIKPALVVIPGHMFVGYYLDKEKQRPQFLETTMLGAGPHPRSIKESGQQFSAAVIFANQEYDQKALPGLQQHTRGYSFIEIEKMRQAGVNAIPHSSNATQALALPDMR